MKKVYNSLLPSFAFEFALCVCRPFSLCDHQVAIFILPENLFLNTVIWYTIGASVVLDKCTNEAMLFF